MKHDQYHTNATYNSQTAWNAKDTLPYKTDNGMGCLLSVIIFLSLAIAIVWYNGLLF